MRPLGWLRGLFLTVLLAGQGAVGIDLNVNDPGWFTPCSCALTFVVMHLDTGLTFAKSLVPC